MSIKLSPNSTKNEKCQSNRWNKCSTFYCGLKKNNKDDLVLIKLDEPADIHGVFTNSKTPGEPLYGIDLLLIMGRSRLSLSNSNANVLNGKSGKENH